MKTEIVKDNLVITIPLAKNPPTSKSGKSLMLATTNGNVKPAGLLYKGKQVSLGVNAYVPAGETAAE